MYILKDENENIVSYSDSYSAICDAKKMIHLDNGVISSTDEKIVTNDGRMYLQSEWDKYKESSEYKFNCAKNDAEHEISNLKDELQSGDYKIIKAFEAMIADKEAPYDMTTLLLERNSKRERINELEALFFGAI